MLAPTIWARAAADSAAVFTTPLGAFWLTSVPALPEFHPEGIMPLSEHEQRQLEQIQKKEQDMDALRKREQLAGLVWGWFDGPRSGLGASGYRLALEAALEHIEEQAKRP